MAAFSNLFIIVVTALLLHARIKFVVELKINRAAASDSFDNPDCDSKRCPRICSKYDPEFEVNDYCTQCHYKKRYSLNFVSDGKNGDRCLTSSEVVKESDRLMNIC